MSHQHSLLRICRRVTVRISISNSNKVSRPHKCRNAVLVLLIISEMRVMRHYEKLKNQYHSDTCSTLAMRIITAGLFRVCRCYSNATLTTFVSFSGVRTFLVFSAVDS